MLIPLDERMASRAHAVFDTIYIKKAKLINVTIRLRVGEATFGQVGCLGQQVGDLSAFKCGADGAGATPDGRSDL
jgi:hypothetical protein